MQQPVFHAESADVERGGSTSNRHAVVEWLRERNQEARTKLLLLLLEPSSQRSLRKLRKLAQSPLAFFVDFLRNHLVVEPTEFERNARSSGLTEAKREARKAERAEAKREARKAERAEAKREARKAERAEAKREARKAERAEAKRKRPGPESVPDLPPKTESVKAWAPRPIANDDARSPYQGLPASRFWRSGVCEQDPASIENLYSKKFEIAPDAQIATAGSCFAQHIAKRMREQGYNVMDVEPPPRYMSAELAKRFGYGLYSARYGNIYHVRQLLQLAQEAYGIIEPAAWIWTAGGRFFDALRPGVEPQGLESPEEVRAHREAHLVHVAELFGSMDLFIFTLGLTEAWIHRASGTVFPTAPGVIAGTFDEDECQFKNFTSSEIYADFVEFRTLILSKNPTVKFLLTVSPVPLTATASHEHVLSATTYSKSVLRAVAGELASAFADVDYFPSYEIIASPWSRGSFYKPNLRSIDPIGVDAVMRVFFLQHGLQALSSVSSPPTKPAAPVANEDEVEVEVVCEDVLIQEFAK